MNYVISYFEVVDAHVLLFIWHQLFNLIDVRFFEIFTKYYFKKYKKVEKNVNLYVHFFLIWTISDFTANVYFRPIFDAVWPLYFIQEPNALQNNFIFENLEYELYDLIPILKLSMLMFCCSYDMLTSTISNSESRFLWI